MSGKRIAKTLSGQMIDIVEKYREHNGGEKYTAHEAAVWAVDEHLWDAQKEDMYKLCAKAMSQAMRSIKTRDPIGRRIRQYHAAHQMTIGDDGKKQQQTFWDSNDTASHEFKLQSFLQRHRGIGGDCRQLYSDQESHNDFHRPDDCEPIQLNFDMTNILAEDENHDADAVD